MGFTLALRYHLRWFHTCRGMRVYLVKSAASLTFIYGGAACGMDVCPPKTRRIHPDNSAFPSCFRALYRMNYRQHYHSIETVSGNAACMLIHIILSVSLCISDIRDIHISDIFCQTLYHLMIQYVNMDIINYLIPLSCKAA